MNNQIDIKSVLRSAKITQKEIAEICDVTGVAVNHVVKRRKNSFKIQSVICLLTGKTMLELFPKKKPSPAQDNPAG